MKQEADTFIYSRLWHNAYMQMRMIIGLILFCTSAHAGEADFRVYTTPDEFVGSAFDQDAPVAGSVWPRGELRQQLAAILGHKPGLRFKYWGADGKTVWILDEIGKERPITAGVVVKQNKIEDIRVLVFRESRGWEVKYEFFTNQFKELWLKPSHQLSASVDNITGATLSVKAMTRMAKAALLLHQHSSQATHTVAQAR